MERSEYIVRRFNVAGVCVPDKHYMADIRDKLEKIIAMIEDDEYFENVIKAGFNLEDRRPKKKGWKSII